MDKSFVEIIKDARKQAWKARLTDKVSHLELIPANVAGWKNKLILYLDNGKVIYISPTQKMYFAQFGKNTNAYLLLIFLARQPKKVFAPKELAEAETLNKPRGHADSPTDDRRIRDTVQSIRDKLGLTNNKDEDFFIVDSGYGLKCSVETRI